MEGGKGEGVGMCEAAEQDKVSTRTRGGLSPSCYYCQ